MRINLGDSGGHRAAPAQRDSEVVDGVDGRVGTEFPQFLERTVHPVR
jgi:hypothetical protein